MLERYRNSREKIKIFSAKYKIYIMPLVLIFGFLLDFITLNRVDQLFDNLILVSHIVISGLSIVILFSKDTRLGTKLNIAKHAQKFEYLMLFSFGAIFSGAIVFFSKSAAFGASWPFFLILLVLMLGTEFKKKYFQRLVFQINFYFIAVFSYLIVLIPVLKRDMGPEVFVMSGMTSLVFIAGFFSILYLIDRRRINEYIKRMTFGVFSIFFVFNFLYFANVIPPIPLSLKSAAPYYSVYRISNSNYVGTYEPTPWWNIFRKESRVLKWENGKSIYVFGSVFAPTNLDTKIYHQWQYFDDIRKKWIDSSRIEISISGGRDDGFRGYSFKTSLHHGLWRVRIETERGQRLGGVRLRLIPEDGKNRANEIIL